MDEAKLRTVAQLHEFLDATQEVTFTGAPGEGDQQRYEHISRVLTGLCTTSPWRRSEGGLPGVRVLIVDDSEINLDAAQRIPTDQGALVSLAVNGQAAIDWLLAHANEVDLVLMDVQTPVMDGMEATRQLRRLPQFDDLPIVALTVGAFRSQHNAAKAAHIIGKPFNVPSMIALIQRLRRRPGPRHRRTGGRPGGYEHRDALANMFESANLPR